MNQVLHFLSYDFVRFSVNSILLKTLTYRNPSYWGKLCFMSTPDGENCGLVKNLAVTAIVSSRVVQPLIESFISCGMSKLNEIPTENIQRMDKIFLNGNWVGSCTDSASFVLRLRCMRRSSLIDPQVCSLSHG